MNITLNVSQTLKPGATQVALAVSSYQSKAYKRLMKGLKGISKKAWVKATLKINAKAEAMLSVIMKSLHLIEKTWAFKALTHLSAILVMTVKRDGLKFTMLLTTLGYGVWCATNIL